MGIVIVLQYRGEKARLFDVYREDAPKYLDGFFGDDLRRLKLPTPHEYRLKAWYASRILCRWETWGDKVRQLCVEDVAQIALMLLYESRI